MRASRLAAGFALLLAFCGGAAAARNQALLIGISQYSELNSLRYADSDVQALSQLLVDFAGYRKPDVTVVLNLEATKARITAEIDRVVKESDKDPLDHFILMFAGHGLPGRIDDRESNIFLAPADASTAENTFYSTGTEVVNETFISRAWLARQLSLINAKEIVIILDSCYSGTRAFGALFVENMGYDAKLAGGAGRDITVLRRRSAARERKVAYLASAREDQQAAEYDELRHGALSYCIFEYIARARREIYDDERRSITVDGLYENISALFREVKVAGHALGDLHQPILMPIPDYQGIQGMEVFAIQGSRKRSARADAKGVLEIQADRPGVEVSVDGAKRADVVAGRVELAEGRHHVDLFVPDTSYRVTFTAEITAQQRVVTRAVPLHGVLEVQSYWLQDGRKTPGPPLEVYVNGAHVGQSGLRLDRLAAGTHLLEVRYQGIAKQRQVEIRPGSPLLVNYSVIREAPPKKDDKGVGNVVF